MAYQLLHPLYYQSAEEYQRVYLERLHSDSTIRFHFEISGNPAFCCLTSDILDKIYRIQKLDKSISKICDALPHIALTQFKNRCLVDEIVLTNDIEGVNSTRREINGILRELKDGDKKKRFYGLVKKYSMLDKEKIPLNSCEDIRALYNELVLPEVISDDPDNMPDGTIFRKDLAEVTSPTQKIIHKGVFPEEKIIDCMKEALDILNDERKNVLIRIAVFHYLFGYIHPFYDGNGRTSRFISSYLLACEFEPILGYRLSYTIKENISFYYNAFKICNDPKNKGDLTPFVLVFLEIVEKSMNSLHQALLHRMHDLSTFHDAIDHLSFFSSKTMTEIAFLLIQAELFSEDGIGRTELCQYAEISPATLAKHLKAMEDAGYLTKKRVGREMKYGFELDVLLAHFQKN